MKMKKLQEIDRLVEEALKELQSADVKIEVRKILNKLARKCAEINEEDFDYYSRKILYYNSRLCDGQVETPETKQEEKPALQPLPSDAPDSLYELLRDDETSAIEVWEWFKVNFGTQPREWWMDLKKGDRFIDIIGETRVFDGRIFLGSEPSCEASRCSPYTDPTQSFREKLTPEMQVEFDKVIETINNKSL